jgi:hypothetical protein
MSHAASFFAAVSEIATRMPLDKVEALASAIAALRDRGGRLFLIGVGGSAGNCSHAVNDFPQAVRDRGLQSPVDNVSELTARTNDEGWDTVFAAWLAVSRLKREGRRPGVLGRRRRRRAQYQRQHCQGRGLRQVTLRRSVFGIVGRSSRVTRRHAWRHRGRHTRARAPPW